MTTSASDKVFSGAIAQLYETLLVPLIFAHYADDVARRLAAIPVTRVLEVAAGTGVATRAMAATLPPAAQIVATDLNQAMLDEAASLGASRPITWQRADALALPFEDASFDAVVCQFGAMFFPDRAKGFAEARRVLRPGGTLLFSVWDRIEDNEFADAVTSAVATLFPDDPPRFLARTPHGYHDVATIRRDVADGGFSTPARIDTVTAQSRADTPRVPAVAFCQGTPLRNEIEARDAQRLAEATDVAEVECARRFGRGPIAGRMQAHVVAVAR
jgi:SAM-dependent methyltransferase